MRNNKENLKRKYICNGVIPLIYITGANGMVGSTLVKYLNDIDYGNIDEIITYGKNELDITNFDNIKDIPLEESDIIINLAAETDVDRCELDIDHAYLTNTIGTQNVALACKRANCEMLHLSTVGVFDGNRPPDNPYTEFDIPNPINIYGWTKLWSEEIIKELISKHYIIRPGWMIGGGRAKDKKFVGRTIRQIETGDEIKTVEDEYGSPTYAYDLSRNIMEIIKRKMYGTYHCCTKGYVSRYKLALKIAEILNRPEYMEKIIPVKSGYFVHPAKRPRSESCRNYKLDLLHMNMMRTWDDALRDYISKEWI